MIELEVFWLVKRRCWVFSFASDVGEHFLLLEGTIVKSDTFGVPNFEADF